MELNFLQIRSFIAVIEMGGFAPAASSLNLTASAVSKHIRSLEERLGVRLFDRTTRRVRATVLGQAYFESVKPALLNLADAERAISHAAAVALGPLRISAPMDFGQRHLAGIVTTFSRCWPKVSFDIELTDRFVDLIAEGIDVALRIGALEDSALVAKPLTEFSQSLVAAPTYLSQRGTPQSLSDLIEHDCVNFSFAQAGHWPPLEADQHLPVGPQERHRVNNGELIRALVLAGMGVAYLPSFIVDDSVNSGDLVQILPNEVRTKLPLHAVVPHRRLMSATVRLFLDHLTVHFARGDQ